MFDVKTYKKLRAALGLSVMDVAAALHRMGHARSLPTLRAWEASRVQPRAHDVAALAAVVGVVPGDLIVPESATRRRSRSGKHAAGGTTSNVAE